MCYYCQCEHVWLKTPLCISIASQSHFPLASPVNYQNASYWVAPTLSRPLFPLHLLSSSTTSLQAGRHIWWLWKQGCSLLNLTPPTHLTLHIIYPFPLLFSASGPPVFYNNADERWREWFCLVLFEKWHTPGFDREAQQGLTQACLPYEEISAFRPEGSMPIINDLFKHTGWIHCIEAALSNRVLAQGCFVLWSV